MSRLPLYLDYASTTPVSKDVLEAMTPYFTTHFGNPSSRYHAYGWLAEEALENSKNLIANKLYCNPKEIIFTSGATESINLALKGISVEKIISFESEHKATLDVLNNLKVQKVTLKVDENGLPDWEEVLQHAKVPNSLISSLWVNNETGVICPINKLQAIKKESGCMVHFDATQAVGKIPVSFQESGADMLSFSGHKIFGPKGTGALICKSGIKLSPQIVGGGQQRGLRSGTLNIPGIVGLAKAVETINENASSDFKLLQAYFESEILRLNPSFRINGKESKRVGLISNVQLTGYDGEEVLNKLHKIAVSNGSACNSASTLPSHVLKAMGLSDEAAFASIRFSFSSLVTKDDLDFALGHLKEVLNSIN